jgi:hypothetical protein
MQEQARPNLCIVRDARLGISPTAKATQQRLGAIAQAGGRVVRIEAEALAATSDQIHLLQIRALYRSLYRPLGLSTGALAPLGDTVTGSPKHSLKMV